MFVAHEMYLLNDYYQKRYRGGKRKFNILKSLRGGILLTTCELLSIIEVQGTALLNSGSEALFFCLAC